MAIDENESLDAYSNAYDDYKRNAKHIDIPLWILDLYGSPHDYLSLHVEEGVVERNNHGLIAAEIGWVWCEFFGYDPHNDASQPSTDDGAPHSP